MIVSLPQSKQNEVQLRKFKVILRPYLITSDYGIIDKMQLVTTLFLCLKANLLSNSFDNL